MKEIIENEFGVSILEISKLNGYDNINYLVKTKENSFIFKTYPFTRSNFSLIEAENDALLFLQVDPNPLTPQPILFNDGTYVKNIEIEGEILTCRLLSFLKGKFLAETSPGKTMIGSLGTFLARLDKRLMKYENYVIRSRKCEWDIQQLALNKKYIEDIQLSVMPSTFKSIYLTT